MDPDVRPRRTGILLTKFLCLTFGFLLFIPA
uniref:Uncharacterized protein n=1 Tax=Rhizophora mucronata TaxID=61149 RepID=A0A2P2Q240_RHIMU